jgi:undecaprenyl diphosphate synthase
MRDMPRHIAIIMDGNGRWAEQRGLPRVHGHLEGRKATKRAVLAAGDLGLQALTVYSFSAENWSRPEAEVNALMALIEGSLQEEIDGLDEENVRFVFSGRMHELPRSLQETFASAAERTRNNTGLIFNVACNYGGRAEIVDVCRELARRCAAGELRPEEIDEALFAQHLYLPELPDPDLLIRSGGEMRYSNFLLWEIAYAELYVTAVLWPDFERSDLEEAIHTFRTRERRYGGLGAER